MENKAWECPRCEKINAPFIPHCSCKRNQSTELERMMLNPNAHMDIKKQDNKIKYKFLKE